MDANRCRVIILFTSIIAFFFFLRHRLTLSFAKVELSWPSFLGGGQNPPDFSLYRSLNTLSAEDFPLDKSDRRRTIIVGDIHGMHKSLSALLEIVDYSPESDALIHVGDIVAKGPFEGSMAVLSYMASNNITGVRGNHDQKVIEWRGWLDWISRSPDGRKWLSRLEIKWKEAESDGEDFYEWVRKQMRKHKSRWWGTIPEDLTIFDDHYKIAQAMSASEYQYLISLPLVLHIPHAHAFIVHAGLLPSDPRYKPSDRRQPLARIPTLLRSAKSKHDSDITRLRRVQELSILSDVKQNTEPWVTLNMRGVLENHEVTRGKDGKPWSDIWNRDMSHCDGFEASVTAAARKQKKLSCYPSTVIYGHAASRGLDIKRWSVGLDSGCVYGRSLTALVLGPHQMNIKKPNSHYVIPFSDDSEGRLISIECSLE